MGAEEVTETVDAIEAKHGSYSDAGLDDGDEAESSLELLDEVSAEDFPAVVEQLDPGVTMLLIDESRDQGLDEESDAYRQIINALQTGDTTDVVAAKEEREASEQDLKFEDLNGLDLPDEQDHLYVVELRYPQGASEILVAVIDYTEFIMQEGIDSVGVGDPKAAPTISNVFGSPAVDSVDGWSNVREDHDQLSSRLTERQDEYTDKHVDVELTTEDTKKTNTETFKALKEIVEELKTRLEDLDYESLRGYVRDGDEAKYYPPGGSGEPGGAYVLFEKEEDSEYFRLTPKAEYQFYTQYVIDALVQWEETYEDALEEFDEQSNRVDDDNEDNGNGGGETPEEAYQRGLRDGQNNGNGQNQNPGTVTDNTGTTTDTTATDTNTTGTEDFSSTFDDLLGTDDAGDTTGGEAGDDGKDSKDGSALDQVLQPIRDAITGSGAAGGAGGADGGGMGGMGLMMPMMLMSMIPQMLQMMQQQKDKDDERDSDERDEEPQSAPAPSPGPAPAANTAPPQGATAPPAQTDVPPAPTSPDTPNSMVDMKLPDGSTQRVSSVVSEAINRELNNPNGSDARAAYQGTPGEASAGSPWVARESSAVGTGDIAQWDNRSALVVVTDNGLQVIVNGEMVPLDPHNPPDGGQGGYGEFRGFFHPTGADIDESGETDVGATPPEPPAVSAAAPPPAATAAPPPVTPPATMEVR